MKTNKTSGSAAEWQKSILPADASLQQAIRNLTETGLQIVLVVAGDGSLEGTLTDGDIRRGLLNGLDMQSPIESIVYREPLVVPPQMGQDVVLQLMQANGIHQLPVVTPDRKVVGLHLWDELLVPELRSNTMVIMAGGKGTRLRPHTENCPKPLLKVGNKPILEHIIERAKSQGFHNFVLAIYYLGDMIRDYFADGSSWDVEITYLTEDSPLGTAGALQLLQPVPDAPFLVTNGDVLTDIHYGELLDFHNFNRAEATMAVQLHEWQHPFGVVCIDGVDIIGFEEKPVSRSHINAGVYVLEPGALGCLNPGEPCDMPALFSRLQEQGNRTIVYPMHEPWLDVGRPDDLESADEHTRNK